MRLWISVHLPSLPLEAFRPCWCEPAEYALLDQDRVLTVSREAWVAGIRPGMRRGSASTISPSTVLLERNLKKEEIAFDAIAMALLQFTPEVTIQDDFSILLNVSASLRLFGGRLALCRRLQANIRALGFSARIGTAPTALGAWLLARAGSSRKHPVRRRAIKLETMARRLDKLPCDLLPNAEIHADWLRGIGCNSLGQLRALPRAGLQRRTNEKLLESLDKAYGEAPELFEWIKTPQVFSARVETHDRIEHADALLIGAHRLILQLVGWLVSLQQAVTRFVLYLEHERGRTAIPPTELEVAMAEPTWREEHLVRLLKERLGRIELVAPVIALRLDAAQLTAMLPPTESLFPEPGGSPEEFHRLVELLVARLGKENVLTLVGEADHRPEDANCWMPATDKRPKQTEEPEKLRRPALLLDKPLQLLMRDERPFYGSALKLISGPERIESGWFDDRLAARDYFIAQGTDATCYWVYLERETDARWFLHGLFA